MVLAASLVNNMIYNGAVGVILLRLSPSENYNAKEEKSISIFQATNIIMSSSSFNFLNNVFLRNSQEHVAKIGYTYTLLWIT